MRKGGKRKVEMTLQRAQLLGRLEEPAAALTHTPQAQTPGSHQSRPEEPAEPCLYIAV